MNYSISSIISNSNGNGNGNGNNGNGNSNSNGLNTLVFTEDTDDITPSSARENSMYSNHPDLTKSSSSVDSNNETLKAAVRRLQFELNVERGRGKQKLVSGSQFRMPAPGPHRCEQCDELGRSLKKGKEATRTLRLQLQRALEEIDSMKRSRGNNNDDGPAASISEALMNENKALRIRCDELESIYEKYQANQLSMIEQKNNHDQLQSSKEIELNNCKLQLSGAEATAAQLNIDKENLEMQVSKLRSNIITYKQQLSMAETKRAEIAKQLKDQERDRQEGDELNKEIQRLFSEIDKLGTTIQELSSALKTSNDKVEVEKAKAIAAQQISIKTTLQLDNANKKIDLQDNKINELEKKLQDSERANREKAKEIDTMIINIAGVQKEVSDKDMIIKELLRKMEVEKDEVKKVVEKAIVSSVRLCVVAPTVNVHIPDKKMKFQSSLPDGQLKKFIDDQVFSKYSMLFKQETDDSSPIPGTPLQGWIKLILQEMQTSIEKHVNNAVESAK